MKPFAQFLDPRRFVKAWGVLLLCCALLSPAAAHAHNVTWDMVRRVNAGPPAGRTYNCANCAIALDSMLREGRQWHAQPRFESGGVYQRELSDHYGSPFIRMQHHELIRHMYDAGPLAKGIVFGNRPGMGHYFNVFNDRGNVVFLDAQFSRIVDPFEYPTVELMRTPDMLPGPGHTLAPTLFGDLQPPASGEWLFSHPRL